MKERVVELINEIGNSLDSPDYASKILTECGKEILESVDSLERKTNKLTAIKVVKNEEYNNYRCPCCNQVVYRSQHYCSECGQKLDWQIEKK